MSPEGCPASRPSIPYLPRMRTANPIHPIHPWHPVYSSMGCFQRHSLAPIPAPTKRIRPPRLRHSIAGEVLAHWLCVAKQEIGCVYIWGGTYKLLVEIDDFSKNKYFALGETITFPDLFPIFQIFRLSWETSALKCCHPEGPKRSGSRRIELSSKSTTCFM